MAIHMKRLSTNIRKDQLIRGVLSVIARDGMKHLSVARVSREVGLVPSALYRHFHSKDEMLNAVLEYIQERIQNNFREVCEQTEDPLERLHKFLMRQLKLVHESPAIPVVIFSQGLFSDLNERRQRLHAALNEFRGRLISIVRMGQKEGQIRRDVSPETVVLFWIGILQPAALLYHLSQGKFDIEKQGKQAWKLYEEMITSQRPQRQKVKGRSHSRQLVQNQWRNP
jgi:TetR/AcrR family transcriptional regulator, fatty acid metabolism regulator protein